MIYPDELPFTGLLKILEQEAKFLDPAESHSLFTAIVDALLKDEPPSASVAGGLGLDHGA